MIKRLDTMSREELEKAAGLNRGKKALVIVHPYWERGNPEFDRFISGGRYENYITVVLEYHRDISKLRERLFKVGATETNSLFIVGTKSGMPDPTKGWQKLIGRLEAIGARNVIVSGRDIEKCEMKRIIREIERERKLRDKNNNRLSKLRAIKGVSGKNPGYAACAGITFSKLKASKRFERVKLSRHFR